MPREKESYRDNLEMIMEQYPGKKMLTATEVSKFVGLNVKTVRKRFQFTEGYISVAKLARLMS